MAYSENLFVTPNFTGLSTTTNINGSLFDPMWYQKLCYPYNKPGYLSKPVYGFVIPTISIFSIIFNILAVVIFLTTNRKSPTNIFLIALAFSDLLGITVISPTFILVYGMNNGNKVMTYPFCIYHDLSYYMASMFHFVSKWLTTSLAIQQFFVVAFLFKGPRLCNQKNTTAAIILIVTFAFLINIIPTILSKTYHSLDLFDSTGTRIYTDICKCEVENWETSRIQITVTWMKNVIGTIMPCSILSIATVLLILSLKNARKNITLLHSIEHISIRRKFKRTERTSRTVIAILLCFLVTELPFAVVYTWIMVEPNPQTSIFDLKSRLTLAVFLNLNVYVGSLTTFLIFLTMSKVFRRKLKVLLCLPLSSYDAFQLQFQLYLLRSQSISNDNGII